MNLVYWELNTRHTLETWGNFWRYLTWINLYVGTCTLVLTEQKTTVGWLWQNQTWKNSWYLLFTWREWHGVPNASPPWFGIISKKEQFKGNLPATFLEGEIQMYLGGKKKHFLTDEKESTGLLLQWLPLQVFVSVWTLPLLPGYLGWFSKKIF